MADILIRGMEMPENEPLRIVLNPNGQLFVDHGVTFTEYEAVELPEHGDLIDARRICEQIDDIWDGRPLAPIGAKVLAIIDKSPVIVSASKERSDDA